MTRRPAGDKLTAITFEYCGQADQLAQPGDADQCALWTLALPPNATDDQYSVDGSTGTATRDVKANCAEDELLFVMVNVDPFLV